MTEFDEFFEDGFEDLLLTFGEQVTYLPRGCADKMREICAIVDRSPGGVFIDGEIVVPTLTVRVHNDCVYGIDHNEIDNGDQVLVSIIPHGKQTPQTFSVVENSDGGVTDIAVR